MIETTRAPITTILFTDLVDSTSLMQRVGDERAQRLFEAHHQLLSDAVSAHGGSELQWLGDGLMVAFASTADAVRCAIAMQQAAAHWRAAYREPVVDLRQLCGLIHTIDARRAFGSDSSTGRWGRSLSSRLGS